MLHQELHRGTLPGTGNNPQINKHPEIRPSKMFLQPREAVAAQKPPARITGKRHHRRTPKEKSEGRQGWGQPVPLGQREDVAEVGGTPGSSAPHAGPRAGQLSAGLTGELSSAARPTWRDRMREGQGESSRTRPPPCRALRTVCHRRPPPHPSPHTAVSAVPCPQPWLRRQRKLLSVSWGSSSETACSGAV